MSSGQFAVNDDIEGFFYQSEEESGEEFNECGDKNEERSTHLSSKSKKLLRNKLSAQNSRIKKKKYIQDLEAKQKQLIEQLQQTQHQIDKTNDELNVILSKSKENDSFNNDEKHTYKKLASLVDGKSQEGFMDEDEANMLIELLIEQNRVGVTGKQRRRMVEYYSKRLINFSIPAIYRYLLNASAADTGILAVDNGKAIYQWDQQLYSNINLSNQQGTLFLQGRSRIEEQKHKWTEKINMFHNVTEQIYSTSYQVEEVLLSIKDILTTKQIGQFIVALENRKYNKQIALCQNDYQRPPSKKVKIN